LLAAPVQEALVNELKAAGVDVSLSLEGSLLGLKSLQEGTSDACLLASPTDDPGTGNLRSFPLAFQVVTFLVHSSNPVTELNYPQLVDLFGHTGTLNDWSGLTSNPDWSGRKIALWASRSQSTITLEIFNAVVLRGTSLKQSLRYSTGTAEQLVALVVADPTALVLAPAIPVGNAAVRMLAVRAGTTQQAYTPSPDNVLFGDYPLRLPINLVIGPNTDQETVAKLLQAAYSPAVTAALKAMNCMTVPETERRSILAQYD